MNREQLKKRIRGMPVTLPTVSKKSTMTSDISSAPMKNIV